MREEDTEREREGGERGGGRKRNDARGSADESDDKTERNTRLRQEYHPRLLAHCTVRGRESGACTRIDGRASLPGRAGPRKAALHALSVQFSYARMSVQRVTFVLIGPPASVDLESIPHQHGTRSRSGSRARQP